MKLILRMNTDMQFVPLCEISDQRRNITDVSDLDQGKI